jgi:hypothetical protein
MTVGRAPIANVVWEPKSRGMRGSIGRAGKSPALSFFLSLRAGIGNRSLGVTDKALGGLIGITGQSLPACVRLLRSDVSWGDQQIVHKGRSPMSYDSFSRTFRPI